MKRIIVTPAGREPTLKILAKYLDLFKDEFDEWHLWINTTDKKDIKFIKELGKKEYVRLKVSSIKPNGLKTIMWFYQYAQDPEALYLKLDDDIVYIAKYSIQAMFASKFTNTGAFAVIGNVINNPIVTYLQLALGNIRGLTRCQYDRFDLAAWAAPIYAYRLHSYFLDIISLSEDEKPAFFSLDSPIFTFGLPKWRFLNYERVPINVICWAGEDTSTLLHYAKLKAADSVATIDDESLFTTILPKETLRPNVLVGDSLFAHYAYFPQKQYLDTTEILTRYEEECQRMISS